MTRVLVTGDRAWECRELASRAIERLTKKYGDDLVLVIGGCATGVDINFEIIAKFAHVACEIHPAKWYDLDVPGALIRTAPNGTQYNANAGPRRNKEMVDSGVAFCIAVHKDLASSKGTKGCVKECFRAGVPVYLIDSEDGEPRRIKELP